jgi:MYXO-CTERM domain-containing protein
LPTFTNLPPITTSTATTTATPTPVGDDDDSDESGFSGGAIAGITIGCLAFVGALVFALLFFWRRRRYGSQAPSIFNHPTRGPPSMTFTTVGPVHSGQGYEVLAGGRVARMSALEANTSDIDVSSSPAPQQHISRQIIGVNSSSSDFGLESSPGSRRERSPQHRALHPPPRGRNASLSSSSILMSGPTSPGCMTSSEKGSDGRFSNTTSEQLPYFKDYYSSEDIHPDDKVACLWAYAPRAPDEFELERGDMLKVIGIWDDGVYFPA